MKMEKHDLQIDSSSCDLRALHAWCTIVMMLSLIHSKRPDKDSNQALISRELKDKLWLVDALAAICIRRNEIIATVAKPDGLGNVQVIASACFIHTRRLLIISHQSSGNFLQRFLGLFIAQNPCPTTNATVSLDSTVSLDPPLSPASAVPVAGTSFLVDPETSAPQHLKDCASSADKLLQAFLTYEW